MAWTKDNGSGSGAAAAQYVDGKKSLIEQAITDAGVAKPLAVTASADAVAAKVTAGQADVKATDALGKATAAKTTADTVRGEFDRVVAEAGSSNPEVVQARGTSASLGARLDGVTTQLAEKANKGDSISVGQIDKNLRKLDQTYMTDEFIQQMAGTTPVNSVPADNSITTKKLAFNPLIGLLSKNLFNKDDVVSDKYIASANGAEAGNVNFVASAYIPVTPNTQYTLSYNDQLAWYSSTKVFISGENKDLTSTTKTTTSPANAAYVRLSVPKTVLIQMQFEKSGVATPYEAFGSKFDGSLLNPNIVKAVQSKNLFNKVSVTLDYYINYSTGSLGSNASYAVSDYILIEPNAQYVLNFSEQLTWFNSLKQVISGVDKSGSSSITITSPAKAFYVRISVQKKNLDVAQFEKGNTVTFYQPYGQFVEEYQLSQEVRKKIEPTTPYNVLNALYNPFVKTRIKLIGDSITQGFGGTGYTNDSANGTLIPVTDGTWYVNTNGICWANMLKKYIESKFNKEMIVPIDHEALSFSNKLITLDGETIAGERAQLVNGYTISFDFYGDHFSVFYSKNTFNGTFEIIVDGVQKAVVDCSHTTNIKKQEQVINGLSLNTHKVVIRGLTNSSFVEGLRIKKIAECINWGTSGVHSGFILQRIDSLVESDDDVVILQIGTNDRNQTVANGSLILRRNLVDIYDRVVLSRRKKMILMSSVPASISNENGATMQYHMDDIDNIIAHVANYYHTDYISNYKGLIEYCDLKDITIDSLLSDGLHPNDAGYTFMFKNIIKHLNLGILRDGATWN